MKAKAYQISALKNDIISNYKGALIYGPDFGAVTEVAEQIGHYITPSLSDDFCVISLNPTKIKENNSIVLDEANALSLMGGRRLIWIKEADNSCAFVVETVLEQIQTDAFILITADNLTKSSALKIAAENHLKCLSIACYGDNERDTQQFIQFVLQENQYHITPKALSYLSMQLTDNKMVCRRELEKLMVYMGDNKNIDIADVQQIITQPIVSSYDVLCMSVACGRQKEADTAYQTLLSNGENPVTVVRILTGHFQKLLLGVQAVFQGENIASATKLILFPGQYKWENDVKYQLSVWKKERVIQVLSSLLETEKKIKTTGYPQDLIVARTILSICRLGASKQ